MWNPLKRLMPRDHAEAASTKGDGSFYLYRVRFPEGFRDIASLLPHEIVLASGGLAPEVIVGGCTRLLEEGERITEAVFRPNGRFVDLLHDVIATEAPRLPGLQAEARRQHTGWVYLIDARTPTPGGEVPPHDIIGAFEVRDGALIPESYRRNTDHRLFSANGLFRLEPALHERLIERLMKQASVSQHSTPPPNV